jgi:AcrR family transcriptional regulator
MGPRQIARKFILNTCAVDVSALRVNDRCASPLGLRFGGDLMGEEHMTEKKRRIRRHPSITKDMILDTTERLMLEEGYGSVSTRRVAKEAGLTPALVHYYYPTTDDVFAAVHKRMTARYTEALAEVLQSPHPVRAMWEFQSRWVHTALGVEFIALANHRSAVRGIVLDGTNTARDSHAEALERAMSHTSIDREVLTPYALTTIMVAIARMLLNEERLGITHGHDEVRSFVEWSLDTFSNSTPLR